MLETSKLYSFLSSSSRFNIIFFEGQKLIHDLSLVHDGKNTFSFFRDTVLSFQPLIYFLKDGESFGIYLDSEKPYFRFKIETNSFGQTRTLLFPEIKNKIDIVDLGKCRILKLFPNQATPYTSTIEVKNNNAVEISNTVIKHSYQTDATIFLSSKVDSSMLIHKLPHKELRSERHEDDPESELSTKEFFLENKKFLSKILNTDYKTEQDIIKELSEQNFTYLYGKEVSFNCPCSRNQMVENMARLALSDINQLFQDDHTIEVNCDYCKKRYSISREDVSNAYTKN